MVTLITELELSSETDLNESESESGISEEEKLSSEQDLSQPEPSVALLLIQDDGLQNPDYNDAGELLVETTNSGESEPLFPVK